MQTSELHSVYHCTCKHVFANHFVESGLQCAERRSSELCHKLALVKFLCVHELHLGHVSFTWGKHTSYVPLQKQSSWGWWLGNSWVGCVGHTGTSLLPSASRFAFNTKRRHQHPFALWYISSENARAALLSRGRGVGVKVHRGNANVPCEVFSVWSWSSSRCVPPAAPL